MKPILLSITLLSLLSLSACDRPTVVNVPPATVAVPGPAGPTGATGATGNTGSTGRPGDGTTVIVIPPAASAPTN